MADLFTFVKDRPDDLAELAGLNLYCKVHDALHALTLMDVERLVYALLLAEVDAYAVGYGHADNGSTEDDNYDTADCPLAHLTDGYSGEGDAIDEFVAARRKA
jgi:hypothetical protein